MNIYFSKIFILIIFIISTNVIAEEKVNFSDEATIKEILFDNDWNCGVGDDSGWGGLSVWKFEELNGKKVKGTFNMGGCTVGAGGSHGGTFTGSLKKNTMKYSVKISGGRCSNFSGKLKFFKEDDTSYKADGRLSRTFHGSSFKGTLWCYTE